VSAHTGTAVRGGEPSVRELIASASPLVLAALLVSLGVLLAHAWSLRFLTDDAYISFRYARNLADGYGLVFNPGFERVEGYTNFLWVLLLAGLDWVGIAPETASHPLTLALTAGLWGFVAWFSLRESARGGPQWIAAAPPLLLALTRSVAVWATSGLETRLLEFLVVAGALRLVVEVERSVAHGTRGLPWSAVLFGLAALTRPDAVLIGAAALATGAAWCWLRGRLDLRAHALRFAAWSAIVALHLAFRFGYYGSLVPNTYWAKVSNQSWWDMGAMYFAALFLEYCMWLWIPALALVVLAEWRAFGSKGASQPAAGAPPSPSAFPWIAAAVVIPHALGIAAIGGDHFEYRPADLYFPFAFLAIAAGLRALAAKPLGRRLAPAYVAAIALGLLWLPLEAQRQFPATYRSRFPGWAVESLGVNRFLEPEATVLGELPIARQYLGAYAHVLRNITDHMVGTRREELKLFLEQTENYAQRLRGLVESGAVPRDTHIALGAVGLIPYRTGLRTLDRLGLTDAEVAHQQSRTGKRVMAHEKSATLEYGRAQGVELWGRHPASLIRHVTDRTFFKQLLPAAKGRKPAWVASVGDGYYLIVEFPQGADAALKRFPKLDWKPVDDAQVRGSLLSEAVAAFHKRLEDNPSDSAALLRLGNAYLDSQLPALAIPLLERAAEARPTEAYPHVRAGMAYARSGNFDAARHHQRLALARAEELGDGPELASLRNDLAMLEAEAARPGVLVEPSALVSADPN